MEKQHILRKKIAEILCDYAYNSTKTETTEMTADRIINIVVNYNIEEIERLIDLCKEEDFKQGYCLDSIFWIKQKLQEMKK
jgi:hypothetical protein